MVYYVPLSNPTNHDETLPRPRPLPLPELDSELRLLKIRKLVDDYGIRCKPPLPCIPFLY